MSGCRLWPSAVPPLQSSRLGVLLPGCAVWLGAAILRDPYPTSTREMPASAAGNLLARSKCELLAATHCIVGTSPTVYQALLRAAAGMPVRPGSTPAPW